MDPFSITAGSIGIAGVAANSFQQLHSRIGSFREAPSDIQLVRTNLEDIRRPLLVLQQLSSSAAPATVAAVKDIETAGVLETVQRCSLECDKFLVNIERWTKHSDPGKLVFWDRFLVGVWHKEKFRTFATQLQTCLNTLQLAVEAAQLRAQLRNEMTSASEREIVIQQLNELETKIQAHLNITKNRLVDAQTRIEQLEEDHDGTPEVDQAIDEAKKRAENLLNDQVASGVVFAQAESSRSGIDIGKVFTSEKSKAYVGLPASVVGRVNLRVAEVGTSKASTSHVGVFGEINV